jgi:hypothetical protein
MLMVEPDKPQQNTLHEFNETSSKKHCVMKTTTPKAPVRNGLKDISMEEFWKNPLLPVDALQEKLNGVPVDPKIYPGLSKEIQLFKELLTALGTRRYGAISLLAIIDVLQAVDYFLVQDDFNPDSRDHGYDDDAEVVHRAFLKHEAALRTFEKWLRLQQ